MVSESVRQATHRCGVEVTEVVVFLSDDFFARVAGVARVARVAMTATGLLMHECASSDSDT